MQDTFEHLRDVWEKTGERYANSHKEQRLNKKYGNWRDVEEPGRIIARVSRMGSFGKEMIAKTITEPDMGGKLLERIVKKTNFIPASFLLEGARIVRQVCCIEIRLPSGRVCGHGTGFLVSPDLLMTNHHVLFDRSVSTASRARFDYLEKPDGSYPLAFECRFDPDRFFQTSKELDFTLVAIKPQKGDNSLIRARGWIPLIRESGKILVGELANVIQHPKGTRMQVAIRENKVIGCFDNFLHYETDTDQGSSGAPVCNDSWDIAALHHAGVPRMDDGGRILLRSGNVWNRDPKTALEIDWIANEGVRISRIVAYLDSLDLKAQEKSLYDKCFETPPDLYQTDVEPDPAKKALSHSPFTLVQEPDGTISCSFSLKLTQAS